MKQEPTIDFHSPEFNRTDDLNDCSGNYRIFEPLGDMITADMRHQMERCHQEDPCDPPMEEKAPGKKNDADGFDADLVASPGPLTVISSGRTLIVDTDAERATACRNILNERRLACTVLVTKSAAADPALSRSARPGILAVDALSIAGAFGGFSATVTIKGEQKILTEWPSGKASLFDLVLDLQPVPSYAGELPPLGYYAPGQDASALAEALAELPEMRGRFKKPQFTSLLEKSCFHGRSRKRECLQCQEACPYGAIQSVDRKISVNPYICQGCGACAVACPADAIRLMDPPLEDLLNALRLSLSNRAVTGSPSILVMSEPETAWLDAGKNAGKGGVHLIRFEVTQIGHVRLELILAAFIYGACGVMVACRPQTPTGVKKTVERQVETARAILRGLELPEDSVRFAMDSEENVDARLTAFASDAVTPADDARMDSVRFSPGQDRRTRMILTVQCLSERSGRSPSSLPLPPGSPFGAVTVDAAACTLCMACAAACPSGALSAGGDVPRLVFREALCHQCGLCKDTCPESAVRLLPRLLCNPGAAETPVVLGEAEPFRCVECGAPFAPPLMIDRMQEKLRGHWMYAGDRQMRRLRMCRTCRTRDALMSPDIRDGSQWNRL